jgi:hypothetical protein
MTCCPISGCLGPISEMESNSVSKRAARYVAGQRLVKSARTPLLLGTSRKTRSQNNPGVWRGRAWHRRVGQAFELFEPGVMDSSTANSSPRTATGHKQDDQTAKTKPPTGSCSPNEG